MESIDAFNGFLSFSTKKFITLSVVSVPDSPLTLLVGLKFVLNATAIHTLKICFQFVLSFNLSETKTSWSSLEIFGSNLFPENGCRNHGCV